MTLVDAHDRVVTYLRLSLTERCNLACVYCVPESHAALPADWLSDDEVVQLVAALVPLGLRRVRLTGGEPTLRPRLPELVARLAELGLDDLSLTTNGTRLVELARDLKRAGLHRLNVSLDTLRADRFAVIAHGRATLDDVLRGLDAARDAGFSQSKLNVVALDGMNDDELADLVAFAWSRELLPRFIELMPMSDGEVAPRGRLLSASAIRDRLAAHFGPLVPDAGSDIVGVGPARYLRASGGRIGIIAPVTERFCDRCNRIRISARGRLHACLGIDDVARIDHDPFDLRGPLRKGPDAVRDTVRALVGNKAEGHTFEVDARRLHGGPRRHMIVIGG